jgi:hypothetical protein
MSRGASRHPAGLITCLIVLALSAAPAQAQNLRQPSAGSALKKLVSQTNKLPSSAATRKQKAKLKKAATAARRSARKKPCTSVKQLATYRRSLRGIKVKKGRRNVRGNNRLRALGPLSMTASRALLGSSKTKRCGGGVAPSKLEEPRTTIEQSDANGMKLRVDLPALRFVDADGGGRTWTKLMLPDTDTPAQPGSPGIPVVAKEVGVPEGATMKVAATDSTSYTIDGVDVFPAQPVPADQGPPASVDITKPPYAQPPFLVDSGDYRKRGNVPAEGADGGILGNSRDVTLGSLQVPAAQYDAADKRLKILTSVQVEVKFEGGSHQFSPLLESPWEAPQRRLRSGLLNSPIVHGGVPQIVQRCGEEMLVITNPSTLDAANTFATAKRNQGMRTSVVQTGADPGHIGTTPDEIQTVIRSHLTAADCVHPSYVTILGDDELVATGAGISGIESDLQYSLRDSTDELPDVAVGRIVGNDATEVTDAINKIIGYENGPPSGLWQRRATIAADFQDDNADGQEDRTFTQFAEVARTGILNAPGFGLSVDRVYTESPTGTPLKFNDGTDLPAELKKPTFAWNGGTADITAAWNEGRYLMVHRDHGLPEQWWTPSFTTTEVNALHNGNLLPVVLSVNCASGAFQDDDASFATRALVNPNGGAVGVFGDTEVSPSPHNTQIAWGFLDAMLPRVLPAEGPATKQRMGDALIAGKTRLAGIWSPSSDGATRNELYLWHYFGDPSMQMFGGDPIAFPTIQDFRAVFDKNAIGPPQPDPPPYGVRVTLPTGYNGQAFSLLRNGQVVGKGVAADDQAVVPAQFDSTQPKRGELLVAFEGDGAVPIQIPVDGVPEEQQQPPPDPGPKTDTRVTITCPQHTGTNNGTAHITGTLTPAFAGAAVQLTYQPRTDANPPGPAVNRVATTDAQGNWKDDFDTGANDPNRKGDGGFWTVTAKYAGDSTHNAASPVSCQFLEPNN